MNVTAMKLVLGSMYNAEVSVAPTEALNVYAAASFLQLNELATTATSIMIENINPLVGWVMLIDIAYVCCDNGVQVRT